jgi:hypothetical protein
MSLIAISIGHAHVQVGENPMVGVYTTEGCDRPFFSVAALASNMATRLGSAVVSVVSSFWGKKSNAKPEPRSDGNARSQQLTSLPSSFCLNDSRRCVTSISLSPQQDLCAMADNFGRVMLLDVSTGTVVRMWKGYRDAQVGWISAAGKLAKATTNACTSCFLVIFAPRRSLVEIWAMRGGGRVVAFTVPDGSNLLYSPSVIFGSVPALLAGNRCVLLTDEGKCYELSVPFSLAERYNIFIMIWFAHSLAMCLAPVHETAACCRAWRSIWGCTSRRWRIFCASSAT